VTASNDFSHMLNVAKLSEQGKFDFVFLADSPAAGVGTPAALSRLPNKMNRFEPLTLLSALAVCTDRIGLAATVSTSYYEPFNVARLFASLDHLSHGRACWNVVTSDHLETAFNYNHDALPPHAERYQRAQESSKSHSACGKAGNPTRWCWTVRTTSISTPTSCTL
jgi:alkanesulfonate monooxygenase SsuD/methylene tetrahydromethanopterin reductase-like flavin-dependent oxidoreductase (luciferase family)